MATLDELLNRREALRRLRAEGVQRLRADQEEVVYRPDTEMAAALADLDRQIAAVNSGGSPVSMVRFQTSKGL
ncbi:MAG: hypothetical protein JZU64_18760 [Rhodoferax sp.]|nr:hypothetical protein [Rhodoferax sp.]